MRHIAIEGMDGVGKTTICKLLATKIGFRLVEKPLSLLFDDNQKKDNYIKIRNKVNASENHNFTALFYGLGSIYMYDIYKNSEIITDRHLASNYAWSGSATNLDVYELLVKKLGAPELTIILYASREELFKRLKNRNNNDSDLVKLTLSENIYQKIKYFCTYFSFPYIFVDTNSKTPEEIVQIIVHRLNQNE